jgi:Tetracyclin repressor-like, C-terminal domain
MDVLLARLGPGPAPEPPLAAQLAAWVRRNGGDADPGTALRAVTVWSRLHGAVRLEIDGNYASMGLEPDLLFAAEVAAFSSGR